MAEIAYIVALIVALLAVGFIAGVLYSDSSGEEPSEPEPPLPPKREPLTAKQVIERKAHQPLRAKRASWQEIRAKLEVDQQEVETERRMERAFEAHKDIH